MDAGTIFDKLEQLEKLITTGNILQKPVLTFQETCQYLEISSSHLYKLTSKRAIPHFCPSGKKLYFKREELEAWLLRNKQMSNDGLEQEAAGFLKRKGANK